MKPEYEHPGVYVEETEGGRPIDGVPTDALTPRDRRRWILAVAIGAIIVAAALLLWKSI